ncbi:unnamed protein product [Caretta caretta]
MRRGKGRAVSPLWPRRALPLARPPGPALPHRRQKRGWDCIKLFWLLHHTRRSHSADYSTQPPNPFGVTASQDRVPHPVIARAAGKHAEKMEE